MPDAKKESKQPTSIICMGMAPQYGDQPCMHYRPNVQVDGNPFKNACQLLVEGHRFKTLFNHERCGEYLEEQFNKKFSKVSRKLTKAGKHTAGLKLIDKEKKPLSNEKDDQGSLLEGKSRLVTVPENIEQGADIDGDLRMKIFLDVLNSSPKGGKRHSPGLGGVLAYMKKTINNRASQIPLNEIGEEKQCGNCEFFSVERARGGLLRERTEGRCHLPELEIPRSDAKEPNPNYMKSIPHTQRSCRAYRMKKYLVRNFPLYREIAEERPEIERITREDQIVARLDWLKLLDSLNQWLTTAREDPQEHQQRERCYRVFLELVNSIYHGTVAGDSAMAQKYMRDAKCQKLIGFINQQFKDYRENPPWVRVSKTEITPGESVTITWGDFGGKVSIVQVLSSQSNAEPVTILKTAAACGRHDCTFEGNEGDKFRVEVKQVQRVPKRTIQLPKARSKEITIRSIS